MSYTFESKVTALSNGISADATDESYLSSCSVSAVLMTDLPTDPRELAEAYAAFERRVLQEGEGYFQALQASDTFNSGNLAKHAYRLNFYGLKAQVNAERRGRGISGSAPHPEDWAVNYPEIEAHPDLAFDEDVLTNPA
jgi:hypothetical protein